MNSKIIIRSPENPFYLLGFISKLEYISINIKLALHAHKLNDTNPSYKFFFIDRWHALVFTTPAAIGQNYSTNILQQ